MTRRPLKAAINNQKKYGLLELTPVLAEALEKGELKIKSGQDHKAVVVCTEHKTFHLKKLNQSNSLLLSTPNDDETVIFGSATSLLEPSQGKGAIDWTGIPAWTTGKSEKTIFDLRLHSPCSSSEFDDLWVRKPGVEIDGHVYVVSPETVHLVLIDLITSLISTRDDLNASIDEALKVVDLPDIPDRVVRAVYAKFSLPDGEGLDISIINPWIGRFLLASHTDVTSKAEFIKEWSQSLPLKVDLDLASLEDCMVEASPGYVRYFDSSTLHPDPRGRFRQIFSIKHQWELDEIAPFIRDLVPSNAKLDSWILKYARRTKRNGEILITKRS